MTMMFKELPPKNPIRCGPKVKVKDKLMNLLL